MMPTIPPLSELLQTLGFEREPPHMQQALTHASYVNEHPGASDYERLEFLGDSVLALAICRTIFDRSPDYLEGDLTKMKSMLVSRGTCAQVASQINLHKFLKVGKGMAGSQSLTHSLAAGLLEALIAAIYLDGGFEPAQNFILKNFDPIIEKAHIEQAQGNFKSILQQFAQQHFNTTPAYELLDEKGPDHNKCFETQVVINQRHFASAWGNNKKEAEQKAALNALIELGVIKNYCQEAE